MPKLIKKISDLTLDAKNANRGTRRGAALVEKSLQELGAGRSILADRDGQIIAGNKTLVAATELKLPVRVVETDGHELVVVQRTDLDLSDPTGTARKMAYVDNRASEIGLDWDAQQIAASVVEGLDLSNFDFDLPEFDEKLPMPKSDNLIGILISITVPPRIWLSLRSELDAELLKLSEYGCHIEIKS